MSKRRICYILICNLVCLCMVSCLVAIPFRVAEISLLTIWGKSINIISDKKVVIIPGEPSRIILKLREDVEMAFIWIPEIEVWFGETEVSIRQLACWSQWQANDRKRYMKEFPGYTNDWPAWLASPTMSQQYCRWLNDEFDGRMDLPEGYIFRLPTSAEWTTVCEAGDGRKYPWGNMFPPPSIAGRNKPNLLGEDWKVYSEESLSVIMKPSSSEKYILGYYDSYPGPCEVNKAWANEYGIMGLAGNLKEWCWDEEKADWVLKGPSYGSAVKEAMECKYSYHYEATRWPFCPLIIEHRSSYYTGLRIIIGREI